MAGIDLLVLNYSVVIQWVIYMLCVLVTARLIVGPVARTLHLRKQRLAVTATATGFEGPLAEKEERYKALLLEQREAAQKARYTLREEGKKQEAELLAAASAESGARLKEGQARLAADVARARAELHELTPGLARDLARKLLGREFAA